MISKRSKNATLRKNQRKRSNRRSKKFQMRGGGHYITYKLYFR